jgi:hypothetical protein
LDLDDDHPDGAAPTLLVEERDKVDVSVAERKPNFAEAATPENPPSLLGFQLPAISELNRKSDLVTSDGPVVAEKSTGFSFPKATSANIAAVQPATAVRQSSSASDKSAPPRELNVAPPIFNFGDKIASPKEPNAASTAATFVSISSADKVPQFTFVSSSSAGESAGLQFGVCSDPKPESTSRWVYIVLGVTMFILLFMFYVMGGGGGPVWNIWSEAVFDIVFDLFFFLFWGGVKASLKFVPILSWLESSTILELFCNGLWLCDF